MQHYSIKYRASDGVHSARLKPARSLLEAMELAGIRWIRVGCRRGGCGQCKCKVLHGDYSKQRMSRAHISLEEEESGVILACRIQPIADIEIELITTDLIENTGNR